MASSDTCMNVETDLVVACTRSNRRSQAQKVGIKSKTVHSEIPSEGKKTNGSDLLVRVRIFNLFYSWGFLSWGSRHTLPLSRATWFLSWNGKRIKIPVAWLLLHYFCLGRAHAYIFTDIYTYTHPTFLNSGRACTCIYIYIDIYIPVHGPHYF